MSWEEYRELRLTANVVLRDDAGEVVTFLIGDDPPEWARRQMGPHVWGFRTPRAPGPRLDFNYHSVAVDGRRCYVDVVCDRGHKRRLVARFETGSPLTTDEHGMTRWEWLWTSSLLGTPVNGKSDDPYQAIRGGATQGADGHVGPEVHSKFGDRCPVVYSSEGERHVRLVCCGPRPVQLPWQRWEQRLDLIRHADLAYVKLSDLLDTIGT